LHNTDTSEEEMLPEFGVALFLADVVDNPHKNERNSLVRNFDQVLAAEMGNGVIVPLFNADVNLDKSYYERAVSEVP
jgi:hypothetical protein